MPQFKSLLIRYRYLVLILTLALGQTGCLNSLRPKGSIPAYLGTGSAATGYGSQGSAASSADSHPGFTCPSVPNVNPMQAEYGDGSGNYTVCPSSGNQAAASDILIFGRTYSNTSSVCVFPAEYNSQLGKVYIKPNLASGLPLYQCANIGSMGASISFASTQYNAVLVVETKNLSAMIQCFISNSQIACPAYSYGKFR